MLGALGRGCEVYWEELGSHWVLCGGLGSDFAVIGSTGRDWGTPAITGSTGKDREAFGVTASTGKRLWDTRTLGPLLEQRKGGLGVTGSTSKTGASNWERKRGKGEVGAFERVSLSQIPI